MWATQTWRSDLGHLPARNDRAPGICVHRRQLRPGIGWRIRGGALLKRGYFAASGAGSAAKTVMVMGLDQTTGRSPFSSFANGS